MRCEPERDQNHGPGAEHTSTLCTSFGGKCAEIIVALARAVEPGRTRFSAATPAYTASRDFAPIALGTASFPQGRLREDGRCRWADL